MKPLRLRTSLTLAYTAVLALVLTVLGVVFHRALARQLDDTATEVLSETAQALRGYLHFDNGEPSLAYDASDPEEARFIDDATDYYQIYDANSGRLLVQSPGLEALGLRYAPGEVTDRRFAESVRDIETDAGRLRLTSSIISPRPGEDYLLEVGTLMAPSDRALAGLDGILLSRIVAGLVVAALLGPWFARRALAPLGDLAAATRGITVRNLHDRVAVRGASDEIDQLAADFNGTLERLEQSVDDMRQFSAALAHELRTPLAILRGEAEMELAHPVPSERRHDRLISQIEEYDRLTRLINQILTLARAEAGEIPLVSQPVSLASVASNVAEQIEPVASARSIALTCSATDDAMVAGDAGWLERLLIILLDNAIKFTRENGRVAIAVSRDGRQVSVAVTDSGVGIAPDEIPRLFKRFQRAGTSAARQAPGFGLGLALAKWIADRHGGTIQVTSRVGAGTTFTAAFPALTERRAASMESAGVSRPSLKTT